MSRFVPLFLGPRLTRPAHRPTVNLDPARDTLSSVPATLIQAPVRCLLPTVGAGLAPDPIGSETTIKLPAARSTRFPLRDQDANAAPRLRSLLKVRQIPRLRQAEPRRMLQVLRVVMSRVRPDLLRLPTGPRMVRTHGLRSRPTGARRPRSARLLSRRDGGTPPTARARHDRPMSRCRTTPRRRAGRALAPRCDDTARPPMSR